jgi:isochorismate synthase
MDAIRSKYSKITSLLNLCLKKNIPFVTFRLPNNTSIQTWVQLSGKFNFFESFQEVDNKSGFVYAPFHRKTNFPIILFEPELIYENENFEESLIREISEKTPLYPEYAYESPVEISNEEYLKQAETFIKSFHKGFSKAVLSRAYIKNKSKHFDAGKFFINLQSAYPDAFCHLRENDQIVTWQEKELEEQQIVTDYIESVFQKFKIKDYKKEKVQNLQAGNAIHLVTKFSFNKYYIEKQLGPFISDIHPTPAVCGFPKEKALQLILQTEKHNREYYAGYCGPINYRNTN